MMRGERENFFSREKKFSLSPRAPLSLSRKAEKLFIYLYQPVSENKKRELPFSETPFSLRGFQCLRHSHEAEYQSEDGAGLDDTEHHQIVGKTLVALGEGNTAAGGAFALKDG